jgi:hypothetical protein
MFREIPAEGTTITGIVSGKLRRILVGVEVQLHSGDSVIATTVTNEQGSYCFLGVSKGQYSVHCGNKKKRVLVRAETLIEIDLDNVITVIQMEYAPLWALAQGLDISKDQASQLQKQLGKRSRPISKATFRKLCTKLKIPVSRIGAIKPYFRGREIK